MGEGVAVLVAVLFLLVWIVVEQEQDAESARLQQEVDDLKKDVTLLRERIEQAGHP